MEQQPKIPTLKDAQKPQVKIKGMGAGLTLFDRLKQFKKKDLAFILAGLGTLFMAPLAEHFMMAPEGGASDMSSGFRGPGGSGGAGLFGGGSSPYENGNNSIAQGGAIGGGGDIITPLNVRDPSALVMGPGAAQQPNAGAATPPIPPPTAPARSETDYKDALAGAASRAASAAVKRAPLPMPKVGLSGSQLRGLGAAGGGSSSGSGSLGPIGGGAGGTAGTGGGGLNLVRSGPNFRGAAGARGSNNPSGLDGTKKAGANAGDQFSRTGSALAGLNAAASEAIPTGGSGFNGGGQGGAGANDKAGSGTGPGGSKSVGESLAFLEAKQRQEESLKLEFEKRKLKDNELLMYGIRNDVLKASAGKIGEALTKKFMCTTMNSGCPTPDSDYICKVVGSNAEVNISGAAMTPACGSGGSEAKETSGSCWVVGQTGSAQYPGDASKPALMTCQAGKKGGAAGDPKADTAGRTAPTGMGSSAGLGTVCGKIPPKVAAAPAAAPGAAGTAVAVVDDRQVKLTAYYQDTLGPASKNAEFAQNRLIRGGSTACGTDVPERTATEHLADAKASMVSAGGQASAQDAASLIVFAADKVDISEADKARTARDGAVANITSAKTLIASAKNALTRVDPKTLQSARPDKGIDASAEADIGKAVGQVTSGIADANSKIETLNANIAELEKGIAAFAPVVGDKAPNGALSDQIRVNKAWADVTAAATDKKDYTAKPDTKTSELTIVDKALKSTGEAAAAVHKAYLSAEVAKKPDATEAEKKTAAEDAAKVDPLVKTADTDKVAAQKALKDKTSELVTPIANIAIGSSTPGAPTPVVAAKP